MKQVFVVFNGFQIQTVLNKQESNKVDKTFISDLNILDKLFNDDTDLCVR